MQRSDKLYMKEIGKYKPLQIKHHLTEERRILMKRIRNFYDVQDRYNVEMYLRTRPEDNKSRDIASALRYYGAESKNKDQE